MKKPLRRLLVLAVSTLLSVALAVWLYPRLQRSSVVVEVAEPTPGTLRLYVLGGSTAAGTPYGAPYDMGGLAAHLLGGELGGLRIEVRNLGGSGLETRHALERARALARWEHAPGSAYAVLYSGDNEFLHHAEYPDLLHKERRLFDDPVATPAGRERILRAYAERIDEIVEVLRDAGVEPLLCTGAMNIGDRDPNRSVLEDPAHEERLRVGLERAEASLARGEAEAALAELLALVELEPHFAWLRLRTGQVLRALGRADEAWAHLQASVDWDGYTLSFTTRHNQIVRERAAELGVALIDMEGAFRAGARDGLPGYDLFWDNCHPTLEGFLIMGRGIAQALLAAKHLERALPSPTAEEVRTTFGYSQAFDAEVHVGRGAYMYGLSVLIWKPGPRLERAQRYLDRARELAPEEPNVMCTQAVLSLVAGDLATSRKWWQAAARLKPQMVQYRLTHPDIVRLLRGQGVEDPQAMLRD